MPTEDNPTPDPGLHVSVTHPDLQDFADKLDAFGAGLSDDHQKLLKVLLNAAATNNDPSTVPSWNMGASPGSIAVGAFHPSPPAAIGRMSNIQLHGIKRIVPDPHGDPGGTNVVEECWVVKKPQ
jgi:hypothetical protein